MVLRRPYAFLIKYFRLIHLVITAMLAYLVVKNRSIYQFLKSVITTSTNRYEAFEYINYSLFLIIILAIVLCFIIFWLLKYKDKPRSIYIFIIIGYVIVSIFMLFLFNYMRTITSNILDLKTIRLYRDILLITLIFQYFVALVMAIRALGFDIKKFDFNRDIQELNAEASDSEEVEINPQIDTTNIVRGINKQQREFGYYFKEFKIYIIIILVILGGILIFKGYNFYNTRFKIYLENQYVGSNNILKINDSYYNISGNKSYVIVSFDVYKYGKKERLNINNIALQVGKNEYLPDKTICSKFNTLGNCYKKQYITSEETNYIVTYAVDNLNIQKAYIVYTDSYNQAYKIKLVMKEAK